MNFQKFLIYLKKVLSKQKFKDHLFFIKFIEHSIFILFDVLTNQQNYMLLIILLLNNLISLNFFFLITNWYFMSKI